MSAQGRGAPALRSIALGCGLACPAIGGVAAAQAPATAVATATAPATAPADTATKPTAPPAAAPSLLAELRLNAFASFGYTYNYNAPASRVNGYRVFDSEVNTFAIDVAELVLQKPVAEVGETGFRVDLEVGSAIPRKEQAYGLAIGDGADLQQAVLSYIAPVGRGLRVDFGKFVTPLGAEVIEGYDGYDDNYSRSLLFNYAIPLTHTGVRTSYAFGSALSAMVMVVNGWDDARDNNSGKSIGGQLIIVPAAGTSVALAYVGGPEKPDTNGHVRSTYDLVASWKAAKLLTLGVNGDYGVERGASLVTPGADAVWKGIAGYAKVDVAGPLAIALRAESFRDEGGTRLGAGVPLTLRELTLTPSLELGDRMLVRGDLRLDRASVPVYTRHTADPTKRQTTAALNVVFAY